MSGRVALEDHPCLRQIQLYTASVKSVHATPARDPIVRALRVRSLALHHVPGNPVPSRDVNTEGVGNPGHAAALEYARQIASFRPLLVFTIDSSDCAGRAISGA